MPRTTQKTAAKRPPPRPRPRRKLAASDTLHSTLIAVKSARRSTLADRAAVATPPQRRVATWATRLADSDPTGYAELVAMATNFANGGSWRDHFVTAFRFHEFFVGEFGPRVSYQNFRLWLRTLEVRS
jgi:hypothetical protein